MGVIDGGTGRALMLTAAMLAAPGCGRLGELVYDPNVPPARSVVVEGEIRSVDTRRGRIRVRSERGGTRTVNVDRSTQVVYRRQRYAVGALERGDRVRVYVELDPAGAPWAHRVDVFESASERYQRGREVERLRGRVGIVDLRSGYFTVDMSRDVVVVRVPERLDGKQERQLGRLRRGDTVDLDVLPVSSDEAELVRFN